MNLQSEQQEVNMPIQHQKHSSHPVHQWFKYSNDENSVGSAEGKKLLTLDRKFRPAYLIWDGRMEGAGRLKRYLQFFFLILPISSNSSTDFPSALLFPFPSRLSGCKDVLDSNFFCYILGCIYCTVVVDFVLCSFLDFGVLLTCTSFFLELSLSYHSLLRCFYEDFHWLWCFKTRVFQEI